MTTFKDFSEYIKDGNVIIYRSDIYNYMNKTSGLAIEKTASLNTGYHSHEEICNILSDITGKEVDESVSLFPPFNTDFGKNITLGKNIVINAGCKFQDQGGITIDDGALIGHNVVLATLDHVQNPQHRRDLIPKPIHICKNVWILQ